MGRKISSREVNNLIKEGKIIFAEQNGKRWIYSEISKDELVNRMNSESDIAYLHKEIEYRSISKRIDIQETRDMKKDVIEFTTIYFEGGRYAKVKGSILDNFVFALK